jgi:hypothetical protein
MKLFFVTVLVSIIVLALSSVSWAEPQIISLRPGTAQELMPFFDRLATAQIISSVLGTTIIGISAIICCLILKKRSQDPADVEEK